MTKHDLGNELKYRRLKLNMTQQQLADLLHVDRSYVAALERGRKSPSLDTIAPVIAALGGEVKIEWSGEMSGRSVEVHFSALFVHNIV